MPKKYAPKNRLARTTLIVARMIESEIIVLVITGMNVIQLVGVAMQNPFEFWAALWNQMLLAGNLLLWVLGMAFLWVTNLDRPLLKWLFIEKEDLGG